MAILGSGCVSVVSHFDEYDAGAPPISDAKSEVDTSAAACTSGKYWTMGDTPSALHHPGLPCMGGGCHSTTTKTPMTFGGTIYSIKGLHDENECDGVDGVGGAVAVTDDMGNENTAFGRIQINSVGNFYTNKPLPPTFKVKFFYMGATASPAVTLTDGNCNYCHTQAGFKDAKGRIIPPAP
jgi:hypothetical protein